MDDNDEERVAGFILSSRSESDIVRLLIKGDKRFSDLQKELKMSSGRLNYHLLRMKSLGILQRAHTRGYTLSKKGKRIAEKHLRRADY
jgi:predicted transcriptional regulator